MINVIKLPRYLTGVPEVIRDYNDRQRYVYIEVATGHICVVQSGGRIYSRWTERTRSNIRTKQYLKITLEELNRITKGVYTHRLQFNQYSMYLSHGPLRP